MNAELDHLAKFMTQADHTGTVHNKLLFKLKFYEISQKISKMPATNEEKQKPGQLTTENQPLH